MDYRYYHELFLRGRPHLCRNMVRTRVKGNGMKAASSPATEPNFYTMEYCDEKKASAPDAIISDPDNVASRDDSAFDQTIDMPHPSPPEVLSSSFESTDRFDASSPSVPPALVTPQTTPRQNYGAAWDVPAIPAGLLMPPILLDFGGSRFPALMPSSSASASSSDDEADDETLTLPPLSGEAVFFEGHVFRYMDHLELEDFEDPFDNIVAEDSMAS